MKKAIVLGSLFGVLIMGTINVGAITTKPIGTLSTQNPIYSAPRGYAGTIGPVGPISAKCTVSKSGYVTRSVSASIKQSGSVETSWVYGPTYKSAGTKFKSKHTGYNIYGNYVSFTSSYSY